MFVVYQVASAFLHVPLVLRGFLMGQTGPEAEEDWSDWFDLQLS